MTPSEFVAFMHGVAGTVDTAPSANEWAWIVETLDAVTNQPLPAERPTAVINRQPNARPKNR